GRAVPLLQPRLVHHRRHAERRRRQFDRQPRGVSGQEETGMTRVALQPYRWPDGERCAVVFSADVDAESPFLWNHRGKTVTTLGELEQRRFGPRVGVWRMLDVLDEFDAKASFYVPGIVAETYPELLPAFIARGHEIGLHGYHHERVDQVNDAENAD